MAKRLSIMSIMDSFDLIVHTSILFYPDKKIYLHRIGFGPFDFLNCLFRIGDALVQRRSLAIVSRVSLTAAIEARHAPQTIKPLELFAHKVSLSSAIHTHGIPDTLWRVSMVALEPVVAGLEARPTHHPPRESSSHGTFSAHMTRLATIEANLLARASSKVVVCLSTQRTRFWLCWIGAIRSNVSDLATSKTDCRYILSRLVVQEGCTLA